MRQKLGSTAAHLSPSHFQMPCTGSPSVCQSHEPWGFLEDVIYSHTLALQNLLVPRCQAPLLSLLLSSLLPHFHVNFNRLPGPGITQQRSDSSPWQAPPPPTLGTLPASGGPYCPCLPCTLTEPVSLQAHHSAGFFQHHLPGAAGRNQRNLPGKQKGGASQAHVGAEIPDLSSRAGPSISQLCKLKQLTASP